MFIGRYYHQLEEKGRVSLPKKFREIESRYVITRGLDGGLFIYPDDEWQKEMTRLSSLKFTKKAHRDFIRLMTNDAQEVEADKLGRIMIPEYLRSFAKLTKQVVMIGSFTKIEMWDTETYHNYLEKIETESESIAEDLEFEVLPNSNEKKD